MARDYHLGRFTATVRFLRPSYDVTGTGEREVNYLDDSTRYCEVEDAFLKADPVQEALAEEQTLTLKTWTVRDASTDWRVEYGGTTYDIVRVSPQRFGKTYYQIRRTDLCNE